jgi:hypothetical protein
LQLGRRGDWSQLTALITELCVKENEDLAKQFFNSCCYSQKALQCLKNALGERAADEWWLLYQARRSA